MKQSNPNKLRLICEVCGFESEQLEIRKRFLYCKECAEAKDRRDRFLREEEEWNRGLGQKDIEPE